ncbi:MAG: UbiD family decarboxylase [Planctomycetaceae bacterium]
MGYRTLRECLDALERTGQLLRIETEIDPHLEAAEIQRRVYEAQGPALLFTRVKNCRFPIASNLFGTIERTRFLFRDTLEAVRQLVRLKVDPSEFLRAPWRFLKLPRTLWNLRPKFVSHGAVLRHETSISQLPQVTGWPNDGGAFITLPQVYSEDPNSPGWRHSNLGMYRVQLSGGEYQSDRQVGLHYQIHRSIGTHHAAAIEQGKRLRVNIFVGGSPAMTLAAVMPMPEGLAELMFAGVLGGRRVRMAKPSSDSRDDCAGNPLPVYADADFCITGTVDPNLLLPEGPFGDHLGYYSLTHDFPVLDVEKVTHRKGAIWPFTSVGRPPQEDTSFGEIIHELTGPAIPTVIPGVHAVHAVDAAGVHPLLLAIGSERYVPYEERRRPRELLTCANAVLGQGQLSLAKYLLIIAREDAPDLDIHHIPGFLGHLLERVDWRTDLHFQTQTTIDTLDYSGTGFNAGSKVVIAAAGPARRQLPTEIPTSLTLPDGFSEPKLCLPGILAIQSPEFRQTDHPDRKEPAVNRFLDECSPSHPINQFPLVLLVDDSDFTARSVKNFLWVTFTRSNPATDIHGIAESVVAKHWGCSGSLVIDARIKPHHAPPLREDPEVSRRVDNLAAPGGPLHGIL